jgi:hypothetical protein
VGGEPIIADSAYRHGIDDQDMLHAYAHPVRLFEMDEGFTMVIGATWTAILLEIGVVEGELAPVIVHAMRAREKFLR